VAAIEGQFHSGSPHLAYRMATDYLTTCLASPCEWLSRPPWRDVTSRSWGSRPVGHPVFCHRGTYRERCRLPIHALKCTRCASPLGQGVPRAKVLLFAQPLTSG